MVSLLRGADTLLLASDRPLLPEAAELERLQVVVDGSQEIKNDLWHWFGTSDVKVLLLSRFTANQEMLDKLVAEETTQLINTDLNLRLEFEAPRSLFRPPNVATSAGSVLRGLSDSAWTAQLADQLGVPVDSAEYQLALAPRAISVEAS